MQSFWRVWYKWRWRITWKWWIWSDSDIRIGRSLVLTIMTVLRGVIPFSSCIAFIAVTTSNTGLNCASSTWRAAKRSGRVESRAKTYNKPRRSIFPFPALETLSLLSQHPLNMSPIATLNSPESSKTRSQEDAAPASSPLALFKRPTSTKPSPP